MAHSLQFGRFFAIVVVVVVITTQFQSTVVVALEPGCAKPLGLISGSIADWQLSASSTSGDSDAQPKYGRLYAPPGHAWCANARADNGHHWLLVDLGVDTWVAGLIVQGRDGYDDSGIPTLRRTAARTKAFSISYAHAGAPKGAWTHVEDVYGAKKVFEGNYDGTPGATQTVWLEEVLHTRFVRVHLLEWVGAPCLRLELLGCQECSSIVSGPGSGTRITASTSAPSGAKYHHHQDPTGEHLISCQPEDGRLESHSGWCPAPSHNDVHQWLQFEFSAPTLVTGIVTRGHGARSARVWVTAYTLACSNDSVIWYTYGDAHHATHGHSHSHAHTPKKFGGNMDRDTERRHYLNTPVTCRSLRLHPVNWHGTIGLRAGIIGCPVHTHSHTKGGHTHHHGHSRTLAKIHDDSDVCPEGFFRLNPLVPCFENLAWRKQVWTNDKKHFWHAHEWKHGHVSRAVNNGAESNDSYTHEVKMSHPRARPLSQCAVLDNYYTEEPVWMVDLGRKREVTGVVLITWQGEEDEPISAREAHHESASAGAADNGNRANVVSYRDYIASLEDITVYASNASRVEKLEEEDAEAERSESLSCGTISRENNAIFTSKLYYECSSRGQLARARYVYVKPKPALLHWTRIFNFVICQVFVY